MKKKIILLFGMLCGYAYAELPFTALKGLDDAVTDKLFSPAHAYTAYYGKVLENIRFHGNYGKLIPLTKYQEYEKIPGAQTISLPKLEAQISKAALYRHPSFETSKTDDEAKIESKSWQYPYDGISALIEWLFISPADVFVPNTRNKDVVTALLHKDKSNSYYVISKILQYLQTCQNNSQISKDEFITTIQNIYTNWISTYTSKEQKGLNFINSKASFDADVKIFAQILYDALTQDGTLQKEQEESKSEKNQDDLSIYPRNIAVHALLGYMWAVFSNKTQLLDVYKQAELLKTDVDITALAASEYTKDEYLQIKKKLVNNEMCSSEETTFALCGYEMYDRMYPVAITYDFLKDGRAAYVDCNETAYRNIFMLLLYNNQTQIFEYERLNFLGTGGKISEIKSFFQRYPKIQDQQMSAARNAWSLIVSNLPEKVILKEQNKKLNSIAYAQELSDGYCYELNYGPLGLLAVVNLFYQLTGEASLAIDAAPYYNELLKEETFKTMVAIKLDALCTVWSKIIQKQVDWQTSDKKNISKLIDNLEIHINTQSIGFIKGEESHIDFIYDYKTIEDWRFSILNKNTNYCYRPYNNKSSLYINQHLATSRSKKNCNLDILRQLLFSLYNRYKRLLMDGTAQANIQYSITNRTFTSSDNWYWNNPLILSFLKNMQVPCLSFLNQDNSKAENSAWIKFFHKHQLGQSNINIMMGKIQGGWFSYVTTILNEVCSLNYNYEDFLTVLSWKPNINEIIPFNGPKVALFNAVDSLEKFKKLQELGADIEFWKNKLLFQAAPLQMNTFKYLLTLGADINTLHKWQNFDSINIIEYLIRADIYSASNFLESYAKDALRYIISLPQLKFDYLINGLALRPSTRTSSDQVNAVHKILKKAIKERLQTITTSGDQTQIQELEEAMPTDLLLELQLELQTERTEQMRFEQAEKNRKEQAKQEYESHEKRFKAEQEAREKARQDTEEQAQKEFRKLSKRLNRNRFETRLREYHLKFCRKHDGKKIIDDRIMHELKPEDLDLKEAYEQALLVIIADHEQEYIIEDLDKFEQMVSALPVD